MSPYLFFGELYLHFPHDTIVFIIIYDDEVCVPVGLRRSCAREHNKLSMSLCRLLVGAPMRHDNALFFLFYASVKGMQSPFTWREYSMSSADAIKQSTGLLLRAHVFDFYERIFWLRNFQKKKNRILMARPMVLHQ